MFETDSERHPSPMELNLETPIFHALTAGRSNGLSTGVSIGSSPDMSLYGRPAPDAIASEPDALTEFHRDPLLAPIPIQAYAQPTFPPAPAAAPATIAPLPTTAGSSDGSALSMTRSWLEHGVLDPANEYGRHHRPVPALPCAYRW
jgi:hypothetical protein